MWPLNGQFKPISSFILFVLGDWARFSHPMAIAFVCALRTACRLGGRHQQNDKGVATLFRIAHTVEKAITVISIEEWQPEDPAH